MKNLGEGGIIVSMGKLGLKEVKELSPGAQGLHFTHQSSVFKMHTLTVSSKHNCR
jgi:hypothetical protein